MRPPEKKFRIYGVKEVQSLNEWRLLTRNHGNEERSAYLTGKSWFHAGDTFPTCVAESLQRSGMNPTNFRLQFSVAEHLTVLDTLVAPSRTDLMVYSQLDRTEKAVFAVEAKVTESFDDEICRWIRGAAKTTPDPLRLPIKSGRQSRLDFLNRLLDLDVDANSHLHYQLFHRTTCALLEARNIVASSAFMLVQSFCSCQENWNAYVAFANEMGFGQIEENSFTEAKTLTRFPNISLRLGWVNDPMH
jgi:hypothetical protein